MPDEINAAQLLELTSDVAVAWLSNPRNKIDPDLLPAAIQTIHGALASLGTADTSAPAEPEYEPAVTVRRSLASDDHIISMIDGKPYKMLKRHLGLNGLTPQQYRERYNLKADYPMVARNYAAKRAELAKKIGLGRKPATPAPKAKSAVKAPRSANKKPAASDVPIVQTSTEVPARDKLSMFKGETSSS